MSSVDMLRIRNSRIFVSTKLVTYLHKLLLWLIYLSTVFLRMVACMHRNFSVIYRGIPCFPRF